jgi:predicted transcriptional regulator
MSTLIAASILAFYAVMSALFLLMVVQALARRRIEKAVIKTSLDEAVDGVLVSNAVIKAAVARMQAGRHVSDMDVAELVEETGASVEEVFGTLDMLAKRLGSMKA